MPSRHSFLILLGAVVLTGCGDDGSGTLPGPVATTNDAGARVDAGDSATDSGQSADASASTSTDSGTGNLPGDAGPAKVPQGQWKNVTSNLANLDSECGNLSTLAVQPGTDQLIAGIALKGLWSSKNGGQSWVAIGNGPGSAAFTNRPTCLVFDPSDATRYWETGIYNSGGVYKTIDDGKTFSELGPLTKDPISLDCVSVDFSDPARKVMLAGGHERKQQVFRSGDNGATWTNVGLSLNKYCTWPLVLDANTYLIGCSYEDQGIYRTTDAGATWSQVSEVGGTNAPLVASDGSIYWAKRDNAGLVRSTDAGKTWTQVTGANTVSSVTPLQLPDGRLAALGRETVLVSRNGGATWDPVSTKLPYEDANGFVYSVQQKAFFIKHFTCGSNSVPVPADAIMRFDYDYQAP
ncbi:MAG: glycosyl hydrolase repeat-containing protein [Myxococcaceae bacterium]|nr:glycosyl hydrolase repeat-containing protein [Myxococcaceae bacterium]